MLINKCQTCNHQSICKYKSDYEKVLSDVPLAVASPFKLILDCEYYYNTSCTLNQYYNNCNYSDPTSNSIARSPAGGDTFVY